MWQQHSYSGELEARKAAVWREVVELRKLHAGVRQEHDGVALDFHSSQEHLEQEAARLAALNTELAVVERQLKDTRNEILLLRRNLSGTKGKVLALDEEFANREAELSQLRQEGKRLQGETELLGSRLKDALNSLAALTSKRQGLSSVVEQYEARRSKLVKEIEERLAFAETERDGILGEIQDEAIALMTRIVERDRVKDLLTREAASVATLTARVSLLDRERLSLQDAERLQERRSALESEIPALEKQMKSIDSEMEELQKTQTARQAESERVHRENSENRSIIKTLEDRVGPYDELVSKVSETELLLSALRQLNEKGVKGLEDLLADNANLECALQEAQEKFSVLTKLAGEHFLAG